MDQDTYDRGMAMRRKVHGDAYVDAALANVDDFTRDFQRLATQYGWGEIWADPTLHPTRALDPQSRDARRAGENARIREPLPWRPQQRAHPQ
jgi:hypothetical protein